MAAPTPAPEQNPNDVGTFVSGTAIGFVMASPTEVAAITRQMKSGSVGNLNRKFIDDLLAIKLLAPQESASLLIQPVPMIMNFVSSLRHELVMSYYLQQENR